MLLAPIGVPYYSYVLMSIIDVKDTLYVTVTLRSTSCGIPVHNDRVYKSYHIYHEGQVEDNIHT